MQLRLLVTAAALASFAACGGTDGTGTQGPPRKAVTIAFQPTPPTSININQTAQAAAVVQNDTSNSGVDWLLSCGQTSTCGSLSSLHTTSGETITYTPPSSIGGNSQAVSITASASADHSKNVLAQLSVIAFGNALKGNYVIETAGPDFFGHPCQRVGVVTLDGNGGVVTGEQTVNFVDPKTSQLSTVTDSITGGSYFVGADGRGQLLLNTSDNHIGQNGVEAFGMVVLSNAQVLLSKIDDPKLQGSSNEMSVGTLEMQTSTATPSLGYAFLAHGVDVNGSPMDLGGVLNVDSPQGISGAGSAFDVANPAAYGTGVVSSSTALSGTVSTPDLFGAYQISLATDFAKSIQFTVYPVDATRARMIESDQSFGFTKADIYSQGGATGKYTGLGQFNATYVFLITGRDLGGRAASLASAGRFSATGTGILANGFLDESQVDTLVQIDDTFQASYAVGPGNSPTATADPAGTGRYYIPIGASTGLPKFKFGTSSNGTGSVWVFYMTTVGGPVLILDADVESTLASGLFGGGSGGGVAYPAATQLSFSGLYGTTFTQNSQGVLRNAAGEITANNNNISGAVLNFNGVSGPQLNDTSLSGSFQTGPINNRLTGSISDNLFSNAQGTNSLNMALYPISTTRGFFVEHDLANSSGATVSGDLTFGYYLARTPVCQGCP